MKKFKIALDTSPLYDGNSVRGVGAYTRHLSQSIKEVQKNDTKYRHLTVENIDKPISDYSSYDLVHYPYFDPFKLSLPNINHVKRIVTVHDLIPLQFKEHFPVGIKGELKWFIQKIRLSSVKGIITVSEYSKKVINSLLNYPLQKIYLTYEAASSDFQPNVDPKMLSLVKDKYQLPDKFILFLGDINWNKNIPTLVNACVKLNIPLVIAGSAAIKKVDVHPWTKDIIWLQSKYAELKSKRSNILTLTGFVPDEELPALFKLASLYCQPSYAEGFGLPLLQAMGIGCPLLCSQETSLPEIASDAAFYFDPYDKSSLITVLKKLWQSKSFRESLVLKGQEYSKNFSWYKTAQETLNVYDKVLNDKE